MKEQVKEYLNTNNFICPRQLGLRKNMSTSNVILATEFVTKKLGKKRANACLYLSKAFDSFSHKTLLHKLLERLNVYNCSTSVIRSF